jgi:hypothetical protein
MVALIPLHRHDVVGFSDLSATVDSLALALLIPLLD